MTARIRSEVVTTEQLKSVVEKLVATVMDEKVDPGVRVQAAGLVLNNAFEYEYEAPTALVEEA